MVTSGAYLEKFQCRLLPKIRILHPFSLGGSPLVATDTFLLEDLGHASLTYSPRVTAQIHEWLTNRLER
jgi:hypothetical protein